MKNLRTEETIISSWKGDIDQPVVSICCITYNHADYIEDALEGFLVQETDFPFEILIHDDASTDETAEIIREYEARYPRLIKPIYQKENQFSKGLRINPIFNFPRVKGQYIALCEGDDYWIDSNKLNKQLIILEENTKFSTVFHCVHYQVNNNINNKYYETPKKKELSQKDIILRHYIPTCSIFMRSMIIKKNKLESYIVGDIPLSIIASKEGNIFFLDEVMGVYRKNPNSLTHNKKHLDKARKGMISMYLKMFKHTKPKNYFFISYKIIRLLGGYIKVKKQ